MHRGVEGSHCLMGFYVCFIDKMPFLWYFVSFFSKENTMHLLILAALVGCAIIHKPVGEESPVVTYFGTAKGATEIVDAQRSFDLADTAMEKNMPVSLVRSDDFTGFSAGNSYGVYPGTGGYAAADVVSTMSGWYTGTGAGSSLPTLGTTVVASVPAGDGKIVPCPEGRDRVSVAEQAACAEIDAGRAFAALK